jgi:hypothetical protein
MSKWKDEDIATPELMKEYLKEFKAGTADNKEFVLSEKELAKVSQSLEAMEQFCMEMVANRNRTMYMHDVILMAIGFYGGYLAALDCQSRAENKPNNLN